MVRVYRPENEVFNKDSLASFAGKPITNDHPGVPVNADNWKKFAVGGAGEDVLRDGQFIRVPMTLQDKGVIKDYRTGKKELSVGYACDLKWETGTAPGGEEYDAIQTGIRVNHVAVVTAARGGSKLAIGDDEDNEEGDDDMSELKTRTLTVDGLSCTVEDRSAEIIQRHIQKLETSVADSKTLLDKANTDHAAKVKELNDKIAALETDKSKLEAEKTTLETKVKDSVLTPDKLDAMVKDRALAIAKGKAVVGDKLEVTGKTIDEIKKQVVLAKIGDKAKEWTPDQIGASFESLTADVKVDETKLTATLDNKSPAQQFAQTLHKPGMANNSDAATQAYVDRNKRLGDAYKPQHIRDAEAAASRG
jgi:hypothetical protein